MTEGANGNVLLQGRFLKRRTPYSAPIADCGVRNLRAGTDIAVLTNLRLACDVSIRSNDRVCANSDAGIHIGRGRVLDRHAGEHQRLQNAPPHLLLGTRQVDASVDTSGLPRVLYCHMHDDLSFGSG